MIYAIGLDNDKTFVGFLSRAEEFGEVVTPLNLRAIAQEEWNFAVPSMSGRSFVYGGSEPVELDPHGAYFVRLTDLTAALPEPSALRWRQMLFALSVFLEGIPGRVVNRPNAHAHNGSKALHEAWLSRKGFLVPPSITSSDPKALSAFAEQQGRCIVKALCGMRGIARIVDSDELRRMDPASGPVHVQKLIPGDDIRAHVVGRDVHPEIVTSDSIDYRAPGARNEHRPTKLPDSLCSAIINGTAELGLVFAGWDFKVDADGNYWCLEANPMPGYGVYDRRANGAITWSLLNYLRDGAVH